MRASITLSLRYVNSKYSARGSRNVGYPIPLNLENKLTHSPINLVRRRAKYLLVDFSHGLTLIWHLGMSGRVIIESKETPLIKLSPHDHVIFTTSHNQKIIYRDPRRFGFLRLSSTSQLNEIAPFNILGVEALDDHHLNGYTFHQCLIQRKISLKSALLDQKIIAGVGNIYASCMDWRVQSRYFYAPTLRSCIRPLTLLWKGKA